MLMRRQASQSLNLAEVINLEEDKSVTTYYGLKYKE